MAKVTNRLTSAKNDVPPPMADKANEWRVRDALETIQRAAEHQNDKGLMREVKKLAKQRIKALGKIG